MFAISTITNGAFGEDKLEQNLSRNLERKKISSFLSTDLLDELLYVS